MHRRPALAAPIAVVLLLGACTAEPAPDPETDTAVEEQRFAARQLDDIMLLAEDFGGQWAANEDPTAINGESEGRGPGGEAVEQPDICAWATAWSPDPTAFYTHSWRTYTTGDGVTFAQVWATAIEPETDPADLLGDLREAVEACGTNPDPAAQPDGTVTLVPDTLAQLGDESFSYRADFAHPDFGVYGTGEVHTVLCGSLWLHLSYVGYDPFVERDALLATLLDRAGPLGGCEA